MLGQYRFTRGCSRDIGVAVPIAADPAAEADHRRYVDAVKIRVVAVGSADRAFQASIDHGYRVKQGLAEMVHAPCVSHGASGREGGPRRFSTVPGCVRRFRVWVSLYSMAFGGASSASLLSKIRRICSMIDRRLIGRVCSEHRHVADLFEQVPQFLGIDAHVAQVTHTGVERSAPQHAAVSRNAPPLAVLETLFGGVDQLEIDAEGANDRAQGVGRQLADEFFRRARRTGSGSLRSCRKPLRSRSTARTTSVPDWLLITSPSRRPRSLTLPRRALSCFTQALTKGSLTDLHSLGHMAGSGTAQSRADGSSHWYTLTNPPFCRINCGRQSTHFFDVVPMPLISHTPAWKSLEQLWDRTAGLRMRDLFEEDPGRYERFSLEECGIHLDYSKTLSPTRRCST